MPAGSVGDEVGVVVLDPEYRNGLAAGLDEEGVDVSEDDVAMGSGGDDAGLQIDDEESRVGTVGQGAHRSILGGESGLCLLRGVVRERTEEISSEQSDGVDGAVGWGEGKE